MRDGPRIRRRLRRLCEIRSPLTTKGTKAHEGTRFGGDCPWRYFVSFVVSLYVDCGKYCLGTGTDRSGGTAVGRADNITLVGVSKTFPVECIREAYAAGLRVFGENRVQEFAGKVDALRDLRDVEWHLIGHLQTNKAAKAVELFDAVDSVDSVRMAEKLNASAESAGRNYPS